MYDYMIYDMPEPANFDAYPRYRLKVLAPPTGGNVTLKFENYNNTASHEIVQSAVAGQWTELEYNFAGLDYPNLTRMVIFYDFEGTTPDINWYIDDIIKVLPEPLSLESTLPLIVINTFGVSIPDEPKISGEMGIIDNGPGQINRLGDPFNGYNGAIGIEIRGQSSQLFLKKSYAVKTRDASGNNLDVSLLGMPAENDWVLYGPYSDKSMLRNVVSFEIGRRMGEYGSRTGYCEVVINDDYKGVYVLMEKIKKDENRVNIATLKPDEIAGDDLTGGYIIKVDKIGPYFSYYYDGWLSRPVPSYPNAMDITFQYYYPEPADLAGQQKNYIKGFIADAQDALITTDFSDKNNGYNHYFDAPSFVDFMLQSEIAKEVDKYRYSTFFYKKKDSDGGKLFAGPAWDFNLGYGNVDYWDPGITYTGWLYTTVESHAWSIMFWWKRMMEDNYFRSLTKTRWLNLRQNKLSNSSLQAVCDSLVNELGQSIERNYQRWPVLGQYVWPNYNWYGNTYADEVEYFENYLFNRLAWMDANITGTPLQPWIGINAQSNRVQLTLYGDYFRSPVLSITDFKLNQAPGGLYISAIRYLDATSCELILSEDVTQVSQLSVTVSEHAINTYNDLTSNTLATAGVTDRGSIGNQLKVVTSGNMIYFQALNPDIFPLNAEIFDLSGKIVREFELHQPFSGGFETNISSGLYLIRLFNKNSSAVYKIALAN